VAKKKLIWKDKSWKLERKIKRQVKYDLVWKNLLTPEQKGA
jgi:hypothetical protein